MTNAYDFNDAGNQRSFNLIPAGTICTLQLHIRPGGVGEGGWQKSFSNGSCRGLDCEFTAVDGPYAKQHIWKTVILEGTTPGHAEAADISRKFIKAVLDCSRGIRPDDESEAAKQARILKNGWADLDGLRFIARLGIEPPNDGYEAKNKITEVITPERRGWKPVEQISQSSGSTSPAPAPTGTITRPDWAKESGNG